MISTHAGASIDWPLVSLFLERMREQFGARLKEVILYGSRARGDSTPESDYDFLLVLDRVSRADYDVVDDITGDLLFAHGAVFSAIAIPETRRNEYRDIDMFLMNVYREGLRL